MRWKAGLVLVLRILITSMNSRKEPYERDALAEKRRERTATHRPAVQEQERNRRWVRRVVCYEMDLERLARVLNRSMEVVDRVNDLLTLSPLYRKFSGRRCAPDEGTYQSNSCSQ